jgi:hypothetical protein
MVNIYKNFQLLKYKSILEITDQNENFVDMETSRYNYKLYVDM